MRQNSGSRGPIAAGLACLVLTMAGCGSDAPEITVPSPDASSRAECAKFVGALPEQLSGQQGMVNQKDLVAYYGKGKEAIVLRCGVDKPASLTPTSRCDRVNDIGWFTQDRPDTGYIFTTIGRAAYVEVSVPAKFAPEADVLNELTKAVSAVPEVKPCQ